MFKFTPFFIIIRRFMRRTFRLWVDNFVPPVLSNLLFFLILNFILEHKYLPAFHISYIDFIIPGLILSGVSSPSYANVMTAVVQLKLQRNIKNLIASPIPNWQIALSYITGGAIYGVILSLLLSCIFHFFLNLPLNHFFHLIILSVIVSFTFSSLGFLNSLWVKKYDNVFLLQNLIILPLIYLGGLFYPFSNLPPTAQLFSYLNPMCYMANLYRYVFLNISEISLTISYLVSITFLIITLLMSCYFAHKKIGLTQ